MGRIYIYKEKTKGGAPPGTTPPRVLVPRPHGLPMQRVRPCPTAEQIGIRYAHPEQRVSV